LREKVSPEATDEEYRLEESPDWPAKPPASSQHPSSDRLAATFSRKRRTLSRRPWRIPNDFKDRAVQERRG
jgi:hypothetical protein